jgi:hypothetical protein
MQNDPPDIGHLQGLQIGPAAGPESGPAAARRRLGAFVMGIELILDLGYHRREQIELAVEMVIDRPSRCPAATVRSSSEVAA